MTNEPVEKLTNGVYSQIATVEDGIVKVFYKALKRQVNTVSGLCYIDRLFNYIKTSFQRGFLW